MGACVLQHCFGCKLLLGLLRGALGMLWEVLLTTGAPPVGSYRPVGESGVLMYIARRPLLTGSSSSDR